MCVLKFKNSTLCKVFCYTLNLKNNQNLKRAQRFGQQPSEKCRTRLESKSRGIKLACSCIFRHSLSVGYLLYWKAVNITAILGCEHILNNPFKKVMVPSQYYVRTQNDKDMLLKFNTYLWIINEKVDTCTIFTLYMAHGNMGCSWQYNEHYHILSPK